MGITIDTSELTKALNALADTSTLTRYFRRIADEIAQICRRELYTRTPKKTGRLAKGWLERDGLRFRVTHNGYELELINKVEYARAVNYGHYSYNQYNVGGPPWHVNPSHRTVFYDSSYGEKPNDPDSFVFGHFFLEKAEVALYSDSRLTSIIEKQLQEWFRECTNG